MTELAAAASFPVVFFDGEREIDIGAVTVHADLGFKKFQAVIGQKIGIAPHQISTSLVRRKKARLSPEVRRRVLIDEATDFAALARERDCFVLAVPRRSRRDRRGGRARRGGGVEAERKAGAGAGAAAAPARTILKRNPAGMGPVFSGSLATDAAEVGVGLWDYERKMGNLQRQRERYLMSTASCYPYPVSAAGLEAFLGDARPRAAAPTAVCEECRGAKEKGRAPGFHWCVYDAVTVGFRSPVGPIQRPSKKHV